MTSEVLCHCKYSRQHHYTQDAYIACQIKIHACHFFTAVVRRRYRSQQCRNNMLNEKIKNSLKKQFEQNEQKYGKGKGRIEYLCLVPGCKKGMKECGLLARSSGSISHLRSHLETRVDEEELDFLASGRFIKRDTTMEDETICLRYV